MIPSRRSARTKSLPALVSCALLATAIATAGACRSIGVGRAGGPDLNQPVPDSFIVAFETSRGRFDVMARKAWAPNGVDRFYALVGNRYYDRARFYRVVNNFVAQFGMAAEPSVTAAWRPRAIADEPVRHGNLRGTIAYARGGPGTRTAQLFINFKDNTRLDTLNGFGFPPIAEVVSGMTVVDSLYSGYGEATPRTGAAAGRSGPQQDSIAR
ncbi:MAG TPA: peptidylprolyl isomerase, partial [Gemmatimonadaceae bacterium]|nr:peptidylprolyl isomerase [Gemmatimonadaceae bacterium]